MPSRTRCLAVVVSVCLLSAFTWLSAAEDFSGARGVLAIRVRLEGDGPASRSALRVAGTVNQGQPKAFDTALSPDGWGFVAITQAGGPVATGIGVIDPTAIGSAFCIDRIVFSDGALPLGQDGGGRPTGVSFGSGRRPVDMALVHVTFLNQGAQATGKVEWHKSSQDAAAAYAVRYPDTPIAIAVRPALPPDALALAQAALVPLPTAVPTAGPRATNQPAGGVRSELESLKRLHDEGLIPQTVYEERVREVLSQPATGSPVPAIAAGLGQGPVPTPVAVPAMAPPKARLTVRWPSANKAGVALVAVIGVGGSSSRRILVDGKVVKDWYFWGNSVEETYTVSPGTITVRGEECAKALLGAGKVGDSHTSKSVTLLPGGHATVVLPRVVAKR